MFKKNGSKKAQIYSLLIIFISAIAAALLFALGSLYYYNPSGIYLGKNVLLSPENLMPIESSGDKMHKKRDTGYSLSAIEFTDLQKNILHRSLSPQEYSSLYAMLADDKGIEAAPPEVKSLFTSSRIATLTLILREENKRSSSLIPFIIVEFIENGDYYRVQLHVETRQAVWAYFYHPAVYQQILTLLK